jgi:cytochrome oxidase Cu insertion factor (SCO1/SenC/PrrC family)
MAQLFRRRLFVSPGAIAAIALLGSTSIACAQGAYSVRGPWVDDQNRIYPLEALRGTYSVVTMAYGACRRVCSSSLKVMHDVADLAAKRHIKLNVLVVGLDPSDDKPADWALLRKERGTWFANVEFLTGSESATQSMARCLGVQYWHYGEHTMHDFKIVLVSPDGRIVKSFDKFDTEASEILP